MTTTLFRSRRWLPISGLALLLLIAIVTPPVVRAQDTVPARVRYDFQSVGFIPGQTIRVSVSLNPPPIGDVPPPQPDRIRILLLDAEGERIADSGAIAWPPGPTRIFDVERSKLNRAGEDGTGRLQVRAVVIVSNPSGLPPSPAMPGVEVVSADTGRTMLALWPPGPSKF